MDAFLAVLPAQLRTMPAWLLGAVALALAILTALALHGLVLRLVARARTRQPFLHSLLHRTRGPTRLALALLVADLALPLLALEAEPHANARHALLVGAIVSIGWIAILAVNIAADLYLERFQRDAGDRVLARKHITQVRLLRRILGSVLILITTGAALMTFEPVRQYGVSLFASAGIAGLVLGLAARPILSNLIAGVQLAVTQPIRIDDLVMVENETGTVEEITSAYVVLRLWDRRRLIVPLTYFIERPFQNWTRQGGGLIGTVVLRTRYTVPIERVRAKLKEALAASKLWDREVAKLEVIDSRETWLELRLSMSAADPGTLAELRNEVRERLIAFLRAEHPDSLPDGPPKEPPPSRPVSDG